MKLFAGILVLWSSLTAWAGLPRERGLWYADYVANENMCLPINRMRVYQSTSAREIVATGNRVSSYDCLVLPGAERGQQELVLPWIRDAAAYAAFVA